MNKPTIDLLKIGITALKKQRNKEDKWQKTFNEMFDGHFVPQYSTDLELAIVKMLEVAYKDSFGTISWWIYEQDFGQECKDKPAMWLADKTPINLRNIDELYAYLIKENFSDKKQPSKENKKQEKEKESAPIEKSLEDLMEDLLNSLCEDINKNGITRKTNDEYLHQFNLDPNKITIKFL